MDFFRMKINGGKQTSCCKFIVISLLMSFFAIYVFFVTSIQTESAMSLQWIPPHRYLEDDPKCLSRAQQHVYRSPSQFFQIPSLLAQGWKSYTLLHKTCTSFFSIRNLKEVFMKSSQIDDRCKYLIFMETSAGLGNKILSLSTAFLYAFLTDRILLINPRGTLAKLLCDPFEGSSWFLPESFPYNELAKSPTLSDFVRYVSNSSSVVLKLEHVQSSGDQAFFCEEIQKLLFNVKWIGWISNQYFVPGLFQMPSFWLRLRPIFPNVSQVFTHIGRLLILPSNDIWGIVIREYWSYLSCSKRRVGLQIRLHGHANIAGFEARVNKQIMECLVGDDILPRTMESENITQILSLMHRQRKEDVDVVALVVSLQGKYYEMMKDLYNRNPSVDGSIIRVEMVSAERRQDNSLRQARLALTEMWLLSLSHTLVTSPYSTFGYVAQSLGGLRPYILNIKEGKEKEAACILGASMEPCNHFPQAPKCMEDEATNNITREHREWMRKHIQQCQDLPHGIQLVDG